MATRIGTLISKALVDRRVSKSEVEALITEAKKNGIVSKAEKAELTKLFQANGDKFDADATAALAGFLGLAVPTPTPGAKDTSLSNKLPVASDPAVLDKHAGQLSYSIVPGGQLFVDGVSYDDVMQGAIGDCYFVGAISAIAFSDPKAIEDCIKDNGDGTYDVRFYKRDYSGRMKPEVVRIDGDVPATRAGGTSRYAKSRDGKELWVSLLEKAYAVWAGKGSFEKIGNGGRPTDVMTAITGVASSYYPTKTNKADVLFDLIQTGVATNTAMTALTYGEDQKDLYTGTGVYAWHNYTVLGATEEKGQKYVQLRNPWGSSEPGNDGKNDGIFKMKLEDFAKLYMGLNVN